VANAHRFYVPVGVISLAVPPVAPVVGETYFDTVLGQLRSWDGTQWVGSSSDAELDTQFLNIPGDAMTGELLLPDQVTEPPSLPAVIAAKGYVDQLVTVSYAPPVVPPARDGLVWAVMPFTPTAIPGLVAWIDPTQDTFADGETVLEYTEHANGLVFTTDGVNGPTFRTGDSPHLDFTSTHVGLTSALQRTFLDGATLVSVNTVMGGSFPMMVVVGPEANGLEMRHSGTSLELVVMYTMTGVYFQHPTPIWNTKAMFALRVQPGATVTAWTNAEPFSYGSVAAMLPEAQKIYIGKREGGYYFYGSIYETLVYDGPVSDADMVLLHDYLAAKHGLMLP
jgi:hypothetical protein